MRKLIAVAALLVMPAAGGAADWAEIFEATTNPHIVVAPAYLQEAPVAGGSRWSVLVTANILGPKMGSIPCYLGGVGVDIRALDPAFENSAGWAGRSRTSPRSWGEQVVFRWAGLGLHGRSELGATARTTPGSVSRGAHRVLSRPSVAAKAKEQKALLKLQDGLARDSSRRGATWRPAKAPAGVGTTILRPDPEIIASVGSETGARLASDPRPDLFGGVYGSRQTTVCSYESGHRQLTANGRRRSGFRRYRRGQLRRQANARWQGFSRLEA
jgi:hypothetical protein